MVSILLIISDEMLSASNHEKQHDFKANAHDLRNSYRNNDMYYVQDFSC